MKRKIVQHGPCTLTVSLPARWVRDFDLKKGDEISIEQMKGGLLLSAGKELHHGRKRVSVKGLLHIIHRTVGALYKAGYDEIVVEYGTPAELEEIHAVVSSELIGFEIISETKNEIVIKKVSEPLNDEFRSIFRRIFHFLLSTAQEGLEAAHKEDKQAYQRLILRDHSINKLTNFCRRVVNKRGQNDYQQETAIYHVLEQLERIGDRYKAINRALLMHKGKVPKNALELYGQTNRLLEMYEELFFSFQLQKLDKFFAKYKEIPVEGASQIEYELHAIRQELKDLSGVTIMLHV